MKWVGFFSLEIGQPKYLLPLVLSSIVGGVTGYKSIFYPTIISCSLAGQIRTSKCHSADVIFMLTSRLCLTLSRLWIPKMCVGVRLPWTVKGADAVVLTVCCIYACVACICACSSISSHIWFNSLSCPIPRPFIIHTCLAPCILTLLQPNSTLLLLFHLHLCLSSSVPRSVIYCREAWSDLLRI